MSEYEKSCANCYNNEDLLCNKKGIIIPLEREKDCVCPLWEDAKNAKNKE